MKRITLHIATITIVMLLMIVACHSPRTEAIGNLKFDTVHAHQTTHLMNDTARPACNIEIDLTYISQANTTHMADTLNNYCIATALGAKYQNLTPAQAVEKYVEKYVEEYKQQLTPLLIKDEQNNENKDAIKAWYSYQKKIETKAIRYEGSLLTYQINYDEYTGGAHGIYMTTYLNIDLNTLTPIRLDDLMVEEYEEALTDLLWFQLMADNQVESRQQLEEMGYATTGELTPTDNFFFTEKGITFHYNVYDITPYVMGPIQITVPYMLMEHLFNTDSNQLNEIRKKLS